MSSEHMVEGKSAGVQSLVRAFGILEAIADSPGGIGLTQLSKRVGLHSSTVFHLVKTMIALGYVRQAGESKRYRIGGAAFCLASAARNEVELASFADPLLKELASRSGNTALFGLRSGDEMTVVAKAEGNGAFQISDRVGGRRPAHCTGMGKIVLAVMTPSELAEYLATHQLTAFTSKTITNVERLRRDLDSVQSTGLAFDDEEFHAELRCVATPVRDFSGRVIGALAMSGPSWRLSLQSLQTSSDILLDVAGRFSARLGYGGSEVSAESETRTAAARDVVA